MPEKQEIVEDVLYHLGDLFDHEYMLVSVGSRGDYDDHTKEVCLVCVSLMNGNRWRDAVWFPYTPTGNSLGLSLSELKKIYGKPQHVIPRAELAKIWGQTNAISRARY